jgi:hypothetical protein
LSTRIEEGSHGPLRNPRRKHGEASGARSPSLGGARPMPLGTAMSRAPSLHRGGRHRAHRPRRVSGDAPARGTRVGSTDGMAPRRHLTVFTDQRPPRGGYARWRTPETSAQKAAHRASSGNLRRRRWATTARQRGQRRRPRAEEDSRLAGVPARRNALQISVEQSQPRETEDRHVSASSGERRSPAGGGFDEGEHLGRHASQDTNRPSALDEKANVVRTTA